MKTRNIKGSELEFISRINRDGKGVVDVSKGDLGYLKNIAFSMNRLSISNDTYIASEFNSYVVKIKAK